MKKNKLAIVRFLGTNCDRDVWQAGEQTSWNPDWWWYENQYDCDGVDGIVIPGGFSYGDYLRAGALAARAPVMKSVIEAANKGVPVLGICNGFQILCECGLLPGALVKNNGLRFIDTVVRLKMISNHSFWGAKYKRSDSICLPIAHGEGRYFASEQDLKEMYNNDQIWWIYENNPNGSVDDIAGVMNKKKNVAALMPHPERAIFEWMGGMDGLAFFQT